MASRIEFTTVTIPPNTPIVTPVRITPSFNDGVVVRLEQRWPPGPSGLVGIRIGHSGQVVIPDSGADWLITDDEKIAWDMENYPTANAWFVDAYNTDTIVHLVYLRWLLIEIADTPRAPVPLVPIL